MTPLGSTLFYKTRMPESTTNHYKVLGLPETATSADIERAYRKRIGATHPDRAGNEADRLRRTRDSASVNEAGRVLRDPDRRAVYDFDLAVTRRVYLASHVIVTRPVVHPSAGRYPYPPPPKPAPWTSSQTPSPAGADQGPWAEPPRYSAPTAPGSWGDLRQRWRSPGSRSALLAFARWNRLGQWLVVALVWWAAVRAENVFWPASSGDLRPVLAVVLTWLFIGALWARSPSRHPLGQLLHLVGALLGSIFDRPDERAERE